LAKTQIALDEIAAAIFAEVTLPAARPATLNEIFRSTPFALSHSSPETDFAVFYIGGILFPLQPPMLPYGNIIKPVAQERVKK